jgi:hypothetical protein
VSARLIVVTNYYPGATGEDIVRGHIARLCDAHLDRLLNAAALSCLREPEDPTVWIVARAAQDEYDRRGLIDGQRP